MISEQEIGMAERFFETMDADSSRAFFEKFSDLQPFIFIYVMAMSENLKSEEAKYDTLFLTGVAFKAFESHYDRLKQISEKEIDDTEQKIIARYQSLGEKGENELLEGAQALMNATSQPHVLAYIGSAIATADEEYSEEDQGLAFNILQTVVECFHNSGNENSSMRPLR